MKKVFLLVLACAASTSSAHAAALAVTFNPGVVVSGAPSFTADVLNLRTYARSDLNGTKFSETGYFQLFNAALGDTSYNPTGNRTVYSLYYQYSATGTQSLPNFNGSATGSYDTLTYTLFEVAGGSTFGIDSMNNPFVNNNGNNPIALATGRLTSGTSSYSAAPLGAGSNITATFAQQLAGFIVSPSSQLSTQFVKNAAPGSVAVLNNGQSYTINGGGASQSFSAGVPAVPEPATWTMMLVGFGIIASTARYRRRNTATTFA